MNTRSADSFAMLYEQSNELAFTKGTSAQNSSAPLKAVLKFKAVRPSVTVDAGATSSRRNGKRTHDEVDTPPEEEILPLMKRRVRTPRTVASSAPMQQPARRSERMKTVVLRADSPEATSDAGTLGNSGRTAHAGMRNKTECLLPSLNSVGEICGKNVEDEGFKEHLQMHVSAGKFHPDWVGRKWTSKTMVPCAQCHATGELKELQHRCLMRHYKETHFDLESWVCEFCHERQQRKAPKHKLRHYEACLEHPQNIDKPKKRSTR